MTARDCISGKRDAGRVDAERTAETLELLDGLEAEARRNGTWNAATGPAEAAAEAVRIREAEAARRRANAMRQALAVGDLKRRLAAYRTARGEPNVGRAALAVLARDLFERAPGANVEAEHRAVLGLLHGRAEAALRHLRPRAAGLARRPAAQRNVVRELFGEATGDQAAKDAAGAWAEAAELARQWFNDLGGNIAKRADWGLPQAHDALAVGAVGFEDWAAFIAPRLDRVRMLDLDTGAPLSDARLLELLRDTYEAIRTGGWSRLEPRLTPRGRGAVANRRGARRFLQFRDADAWLEYQRRFGEPDVLGAMVGHLNDMAMDIARMKVLGPNPDASVEWLRQAVSKAAAGQGRRAEDRARSVATALTRVNAELTGAAVIPVNGRAARGFQALRNVLTSAQLGAAALSALSDLGLQRVARGFNGLPAVSRALPQILRLMSPGANADQRLAVRMGLVAENWTAMALAQQRYAGDVIGPRWSRLFADVVLRASLLSPWTQAGRWAFGLEFLGHLGDLRSKALGEMPAPTRRALERYGLGDDDWRAVSALPLLRERGAELLDVPALFEAAPEVALKVLRMVQSETEFAVPVGSVRARAQLRQGTRPGTFAGEVMASVAMYKSFAVSIVHSHLMRGLVGAAVGRRGVYLANLVASTTVMGALAIQAKHVANGRDPQDMADPAFWGAAQVQGGGLGIFGDFLFADVNRFGAGPVTTAAGPVAAFAEDLARLTWGNVQQAAAGERSNAGREAVRFAQRYAPGGNLWYSRLALERLLFDELQRMADPDAERAFRRRERRARRERGQRFWWRPGRPAPSRPPRIAGFVGE